MIALCTLSTPNGHKASVMLEEVAVPYTVTAIDIDEDRDAGLAFLPGWAPGPNGRPVALVKGCGRRAD